MEKKVIYKKLIQSIERLVGKFQGNPYYFLNEHDVQAYLYNLLITEFEEQDSKLTPSVHCEISGYEDGKGTFRPDISICDIETFHPKNKENDFYFDECITSIEIKYHINQKKNNALKRLWDPRNKKDAGVYYRLCKFEEFESTILIFDHRDNLNAKDLINIQEKNNDKDKFIKIIYITPKKKICVMNSKECNLDEFGFK